LVGCCENGTELSGSIKVEEFIKHLRLFVAKHNVHMELGAPFESWTSYRLQIPGQYLENGNFLLTKFGRLYAVRHYHSMLTKMHDACRSVNGYSLQYKLLYTHDY
jgi:hypothetical protein